MADLSYAQFMNSLKKGNVAPYYLFYGPEDFLIEQALDKIKSDLISDSEKDFNLEIFYKGDASLSDILVKAKTLPFMSSRRLLIIRDTEKFSATELKLFLPYLDNPVDTTCIIWVSGKASFNYSFYKKLRAQGRAVNFKNLYERQIYDWIQTKAKELGISIDSDASSFLYQMTGNSLRDIYGELTKISSGYPGSRIGVDQIREMASFSRLFTIFELVDYVFDKKAYNAVMVLQRLFNTQGRSTGTLLGILSMLARQARLILQTKAEFQKGRGRREVEEKLRPLPSFVINKYINQEKNWHNRELEEALGRIYQADSSIRVSPNGDIIVESLIFQLCLLERPKGLRKNNLTF